MEKNHKKKKISVYMYNFGIQCKGENPTFASILLSPEWRPLTLPRLHFTNGKQQLKATAV